VKLSTVDAGAVVNKRRFASLRGKVLAAIAGGGALGFAYVGHALAQANSPSGGIGAQLNTISGEAINSGGTAFGMHRGRIAGYRKRLPQSLFGLRPKGRRRVPVQIDALSRHGAYIAPILALAFCPPACARSRDPMLAPPNAPCRF